jgi:steroid delta-isomerase-like uncharacterized protein
VSEQAKELVRRFARDVLAGGHPAAADEILTENFVLRLPGLPAIEGREAFKRGLAEWQAAFPDWEISIEELIAEGDKVAGRWRCRGTHRGPLMGIAPTGRRVSWTANDIFRIEAGRIAENTAEEDIAGLLRQLGASRPATPAAPP